MFNGSFTFYYLFVLFLCLISFGFTSSCIYVSHGFILYWGTGLDKLHANCLSPFKFHKKILLKNTYLLTNLLTQEAPPHTNLKLF